MLAKSSRAVMKSMGISELSSRTVRANSKPSISGIMMSDIMRSTSVPPYMTSYASTALRQPTASYPF